jgi:hypothetical protein
MLARDIPRHHRDGNRPGSPADGGRSSVSANSTAPYEVRLTGTNWPAGEINYDLHITVFYLDAAPEGWSFLA